MENKAIISIKNLEKTFDDNHVSKGINLDIQKNEFLVIIGRSGEGKSVLLKQIIGLIKQDSGTIEINGKDTKLVKQADIFKNCGYVFQFAALLDSLTVFDNIGITMLEKGYPKKEIEKIVLQKLDDVGLSEDVMNKYPSDLSGGMQKRVGLARTLMLEPSILLYDEPTTGLDPITARVIHELMLRTHTKKQITTIAISHDVSIFDFATHAAMLHEGKIIFHDKTDQIWECENPFVKQFIRGKVDGPIK